MTNLRASLVKRLVDHAAAVMPAPREQWGRAMQAEVAHLAAREQLPFAWGCVRGSYRVRMTDPRSLLVAGRWAIILGLIAAAAICLLTGYRLRADDPSTLMSALGVICLAGMLAFVVVGFRRLPTIAVAGLAAATAATLVVGGVGALTGGTVPTSGFYRAILLEQIVGWAALFGLAHLMLALDPEVL